MRTRRARWTIVGLALAGALALVFAVGSPRVASWWSVDDLLSVGPGGSTACFGGECSRHELVWLGGDAMFRKAALATVAAALISAVALLALAGALAAGRRAALAAGAALTATLTAAVAGIVFVATFPGVAALGPAHRAHLDLGAAVYALGLLLAGAAAVVVLRQRADG